MFDVYVELEAGAYTQFDVSNCEIKLEVSSRGVSSEFSRVVDAALDKITSAAGRFFLGAVVS